LTPLLCDTSGLVAFFDASDAHHASVSAAIDAEPGPFIVSPYVLAELDYLLATRRGVDAVLAALSELAGGAWELAHCRAEDVQEARELIDRYRDQEIGLADASLVVLSARYRTADLLTLDRRHFLVLRTLDGGAFTLLPECASCSTPLTPTAPATPARPSTSTS
jgi:predicted nucleic acid-binding protein